MRLVLYAPGLGYYSAGAAKFGADGDFVTAPELSPLFAAACAAPIDAALEALGGGAILEFGPGSGRFAAGLLQALDGRGRAPSEYLLLEVSADLRERQRARLAAAGAGPHARCRWLERLPQRFDGVVFANEVLDAMPCERFVLRGGEAWRLGVCWQDDAPAWAERRADGSRPGDAGFAAAVARALAGLEGALPEGYRGEVHVELPGWVAAVAEMLGRGIVMLIDYGLPRRHYYHPQRTDGTLRCHHRHRAHGDPFSHPGLTDLTAWVDFTAVAEAADAAGLRVDAFTTQAAFLLGSGVEACYAQALADADSEAARARLAHGLRQLLLPGEMGESVKVMVLSRGCDLEPPGLALQDLRGSL
jgi:SAM-dependent MidA family methyltransferase